MDQPLSLTYQTPPVASGASQAADPPLAAAVDGDPESPGRSPHPSSAFSGTGDPLAEGMAAVGGVLLALLTVLVPVGTVIVESLPAAVGQEERAGR